MTAVITVPGSLDDQSFEQVLDSLATHPPDARVIVDARHCNFATPYGLICMLTLAQSRTEQPTFLPPLDANVSSYWARAGFFKYAEELFDVQGSVPRVRLSEEGDTLLGITPLYKAEDVHSVVSRIQERAGTLLSKRLRIESRAQMLFTVSLSEACQNVIEHSQSTGWVMAQVYQYRRRLAGRYVAVFAVSDGGIGFKRSLENRRPLGDRWNDGIALETAVVNHQSRFPEPGRGQGLKAIRNYVIRRRGKLSVRSGTARVSHVPAWDDDVQRVDNLAAFPGAQLQVIIPDNETATS